MIFLRKWHISSGDGFDMGVRRLTRFIHRHDNIFLENFRLHETKLLVDGSNLVHFLYYKTEQTQLSGGDYDLFKVECRKFFENLRRCNVEAFVLFDGGYEQDDRKLPTVLQRKLEKWSRVKKRKNVLPVLGHATFCQALSELNVAQASCVFEADREIAVLARKWKCPVLSNDSDFFIYDLEGGFISIDSVFNKGLVTVLDESGRQVTYLPVKRYKRENFNVYFQQEGHNNLLSDRGGYVLPMFASLMGNDFVEPVKLTNFYYQIIPNFPDQRNLFQIVSSLFRWLDSTENEEDALLQILDTVPESRRTDVRQMLESSLEDYRDIDDFKIFDLEKLFKNKTCVWWSNVKDYYDRDIPEWVLKRMGLCEIDAGFLLNIMVLHRVIFDCQVEDITEKSSYGCSRGLRALIYGIATNPMPQNAVGVPSRNNYVVEFDRKDVRLHKHFVKPRDRALGIPLLPTLNELPSMSNEERRNLLYAGLGIPIDLFEKSMAAPSSQLILGILGHWYKSSKPQVSESHLEAFIICIVMLHITAKYQNGNEKEKLLFPEVVSAISKDEKTKDKLTFFKNRMRKFFNRNNEFSESENFDVEHGFAQFQTILVFTLQLNKILGEPVSLPSHTVIINCSFVYDLCRLLRGGALAKNYIRAVFNWSQIKNVQKLIDYWLECVVCLSQGKAIPHQEEVTH